MKLRIRAARSCARALVLVAAVSCAGRALEASPPPERLGSSGAPAGIDTTEAARVLDPLPVFGERIGRIAYPGMTRVRGPILDARDAASADEIGPLLPSTRVNRNSRGEALLAIRGSPERHVPVFLDGIPLAVPWDERADLSMIPLEAIAGIRASRGMRSVLEGPHALAGAVHLEPFEQRRSGLRARLSFQGGESEAFGARGFCA
ncbi:MAG: TonB-dependent receptor plug domain-containing protein, partial [Candidatus Eisenbacteria bacterium]